MKLLLATLIFFFTQTLVVAQQPDRLSQLSAQIEGLKLTQTGLDKEIKSKQTELKNISAQLFTLEQEFEQLRKTKQDLLQNINLIEQQVSDTNDRISDQRNLSNKRLKAYYLNFGANDSDNLVNAGINSSSKYFWYYKKLRAYEIQIAKELIRLEDSLRQQTLILQESNKQVENLESELLSNKQKATDNKQKYDRLIAELKTKKVENTKLLSQLRAESLRIETAIASLSENLQVASEELKNVTATEGQPIQSQDQKTVTGIIPTDIKTDIFEAKLAYPVSGKLICKFGCKTFDSLGQPVISKGLGFIAEEGAEVRAIAAGKAVYVGKLGDYGQLVIIDHGARLHSLYSLINSIELQSGQIVDKNSILGKVGKIEAPKKYNAYFELRLEGQAVDPHKKLKFD